MTAGRSPISVAKEWCTPPDIVSSVRRVFGGGIGLDPCSNPYSFVNAKVEYRLPDHDGLKEDWTEATIFVNPPYGSDASRGTRIIDWFAKIADAAGGGASVIALVPVATNTRHWKKYVYPIASAVCFLSAPRLRFYINGVEDPKGAPMSCAVIYYGSDISRFGEEFRRHGTVVTLQDAFLEDSNQPALEIEM